MPVEVGIISSDGDIIDNLIIIINYYDYYAAIIHRFCP